MGGRDELHLVKPSQNEPVQIRLVAMRVQDVDVFLAQERQQAAEPPDVELVALVDGVERLHAELAGALVEIELGIVGALQVRDGDVECAAIRLERREQNGLLGSAAAAAAAAELEHVDFAFRIHR